MSYTPTPKTDSEAELTLIDCDDSSVEIYVKRDSKIVHGDIVLADFARQLERERDAALAANAELLERLRERTESHLAASARDVQTIQRQAVEIDRLKAVLADIYSLSRS
jgi:hypothetical protein